MASKKTPQPLSLNELKVLQFIEVYVEEHGLAPTYQEIKDHFGFASFNSVQRYIKNLQEKNYVSIPAGNQKRALQILHPSRSISNSLTERTSVSSVLTNPPSQHKKEAPTSESPSQVESLSLPLLGRVAAGLPIEAFTHDEYVEVPASLVRQPAKTFALIVQGQSMIEDGILEGDVILVQKQTYANNGETVVAMVNHQATVKKFYLHRGGKDTGKEDIHTNPQSAAHSSQQVELRPANSTMESFWYAPQAVNIQGVVVALMRRF
jgi:repressor LexA